MGGDPRKASQVRVRVRVRVSRRVRPGGEGSQFRVGQSEVTIVGNWASVLPGNSGRLHGHALKYVWGIRKWGVYPPILINPWLRAALGIGVWSWDFNFPAFSISSHHFPSLRLGICPPAAWGSLLRLTVGALGSSWLGMESRESEMATGNICWRTCSSLLDCIFYFLSLLSVSHCNISFMKRGTFLCFVHRVALETWSLSCLFNFKQH